MAIRIVRLGSERAHDEGPRIGTVRRPPRGVAPSVETMKLGQAATDERGWAAFAQRYRAEMAAPDAARSLDLLAALSRGAHFALGCYCENEARCHRSILRDLLQQRGAALA